MSQTANSQRRCQSEVSIATDARKKHAALKLEAETLKGQWLTAQAKADEMAHTIETTFGNWAWDLEITCQCAVATGLEWTHENDCPAKKGG